MKFTYDNVSYVGWGDSVLGALNDITKILANEFIQGVLTKDKLKLCEVNSLMQLLITWNIPFEINFTERSRSEASSITITITLSPSTNIQHLINLEGGTVDFSS